MYSSWRSNIGTAGFPQDLGEVPGGCRAVEKYGSSCYAGPYQANVQQSFETMYLAPDRLCQVNFETLLYFENREVKIMSAAQEKRSSNPS